MATNARKAKSRELGEKKSARRSEDVTPIEEKRNDTGKSGTDCESLAGDEKCESVLPQDESPVEEIPPTPEPVYEEPVLPKLILESYEGDKDKGEYAGTGTAMFKMGHNYQGQFMQGLMHGIGTYTWSDGLIYEGEFTQNKVTGKGLYKWPDGSMYDGDVQEGLRHGFGTFISSSKTMSYTGQWDEGKRHGKGRMNYDAEGQSYYEGDWTNNKKHGWGERCYPSGNIYQGLWFNDVRHGEGTMRWLDGDQMYTGQWQCGIQTGTGEHIWFLKRVGGSQYPLRNMYDGDFEKGMRKGQGTFNYANGARYEGEWRNNMKHGKGKFIFKNGRVYEGVFENDHILEFPEFHMDGMNTPDLTMIHTRMPLPSENAIIVVPGSSHSNDSHNTHSPSFQLDVEHLLARLPDHDRDFESSQVLYVMMRHMTGMRKIYNFYSALGYEESPDNTFVMNRMQMWRFLKDCRLHHLGSTLSDMDRVLAKGDGGEVKPEDIHSPYTKVLFREFLNHLVSLAFDLYSTEYMGEPGEKPLLAWCMSRLINENILRHGCSVQGYIYKEARRAINVLHHHDQAYEVFQTMSSPSKSKPNEPTLRMRQFLLMLKDLNLINSVLTAKKVIDVLAMDDPAVTDQEGSTVNLELEMVFVEFLEALVGCAEWFVTEAVVKDPSTPVPSTTPTQQPSSQPPPPTHSITSSSHGGAESSQAEEEEDDGGSAQSGAMGEWKSPPSSATSQFTAHSQPTPGSAVGKKSELMAHKQSESFASSQMTQHIVQSMVSMPAETDIAEDAEGNEETEEDNFEEELDENTRQFNFWTHQVHIFFVRKFFPAAHRLAVLGNLVKQQFK